MVPPFCLYPPTFAAPPRKLVYRATLVPPRIADHILIKKCLIAFRKILSTMRRSFSGEQS